MGSNFCTFWYLFGVTLGALLGYLGVTLESLLAYDGEFGLLWKYSGAYEGDFGSPLGHVGATLGLHWGHFWLMRVTLG